MKLNALIAGVGVIASMQASVSSSRATQLLSLPDVSATKAGYALSFYATGSTATISVGGYQVPAWEFVFDNAVVLNGSSTNLLASSWTETKAPIGSDTMTYGDGTSVRALKFGALVVGSYDTYSQSFGTQKGSEYTYSFEYTNQVPVASGLLVSVDGGALTGNSGGSGGGSGGRPGGGPGVPSGVPEPSTWALMLAGFGLIGFVSHRRRARFAPV